jgi:hypothetical protein
LPHLTTIDRGYLIPALRGEPGSEIIDRYPSQTLLLLHTILPDNVTAWPYGIGEALNRIGEADNNLKQDERLLELNRKWNSR